LVQPKALRAYFLCYTLKLLYSLELYKLSKNNFDSSQPRRVTLYQGAVGERKKEEKKREEDRENEINKK